MKSLETHLREVSLEVIREGLQDSIDDPLLKVSTQEKFGDYQINGVLAFAKSQGKNPRQLAIPIAEKILQRPEIEKAEIAGPGFINLFLDRTWMEKQLVEVLADTKRDGVAVISDPKKIVVDFSSPNIAKRMHVGHLRSTIIGDCIRRLLRFVGHEVIADNHLGDWGTQFGLLIMGMRTWGDSNALDIDPIDELERVYKLASEKAGKDPLFADAARNELKKLQQGDEENHQLWSRFVETTKAALEKVYARLDVTFDLWLGESSYQDQLENVIKLLRDKSIAKEDQGAICIFWEDQPNAPKELKRQKEPFIIQKKDGAFLYSTTDIASVLYRKETLHADKSIYVVDNRQSLHFKQLFATMALLDLQIDLEHVGFGAVLGNDGKPLRTRDVHGQRVTLESLLDEAEKQALQRIENEGFNISAENLENVASTVGIGAVKYADLRQNRLTDYRFDWNKMISFKGNAGPYLQYAYARICSIFRKMEIQIEETIELDFFVLLEPVERNLALLLLRFSDVVLRAAETRQPHLICDHLFLLAKSFSGFYESCSILKAENETLRQSRLALASLTARHLKRGLGLLGIQVVERM